MTKREPKPLVIRQIDEHTWSVQEKAVPGFRLSRSTMAAARDLTNDEEEE